jgi:hypothetical protein
MFTNVSTHTTPIVTPAMAMLLSDSDGQKTVR